MSIGPLSACDNSFLRLNLITRNSIHFLLFLCSALNLKRALPNEIDERIREFRKMQFSTAAAAFVRNERRKKRAYLWRCSDIAVAMGSLALDWNEIRSISFVSVERVEETLKLNSSAAKQCDAQPAKWNKSGVRASGVRNSK